MARFNKIRFCLLAVASSISCSILLADDEPSSPTSETKTLKGKVVKVIDGDSIVLKTDSNEETIHLDGIDAPEFKQSGGDKSSSFLKKLINEKDVEVRWEKKDNFQRILGTVYLGETNINLEMVAKGWAWHFERYNKSDQLAEAQKAAKEAKLGLWKEAEPVAPWDYRKNNPRDAK